MGKGLLQFGQFVVAVLLLLFASSAIKSGRSGVAIAVFVAMAGFFAWRLIRDGTASPETQPISDRPKARIDLLGILFIALWLAALMIVTGAFGDHPDIYTALCGIGVAIGIMRVIKYRKPSD